MEDLLQKISWLGHASFRIDNQKRIYIDPWKLGVEPEADLILITHNHYDHCEPKDVAKIQEEKTIIVCPKDCAVKFKGDVRVVKPGDRLNLAGIEIEVVPAYNLNKSFHPKEKGWVGYILHLAGGSIYHAGDTDLIPEMEQVKCDIALLPVGGTYTMDAAEAAKAAQQIKPQVAVPMHWGDIVGSRADAEKFQSLFSPAKILKATRY